MELSSDLLLASLDRAPSPRVLIADFIELVLASALTDSELGSSSQAIQARQSACVGFGSFFFTSPPFPVEGLDTRAPTPGQGSWRGSQQRGDGSSQAEKAKAQGKPVKRTFRFSVPEGRWGYTGGSTCQILVIFGLMSNYRADRNLALCHLLLTSLVKLRS